MPIHPTLKQNYDATATKISNEFVRALQMLSLVRRASSLGCEMGIKKKKIVTQT